MFLGERFLRATMLLADGGSDNFKVAVVTTIGVVIAAGFTALATTRQRTPPPSPTPPAPVPLSQDVLIQQYITGLEHDRAEKSLKLAELQTLYTKLRDACWERGNDPDDLIAQQQGNTP